MEVPLTCATICHTSSHSWQDDTPPKCAPQGMTGRHLGPKSAVAALEELFLGAGASRDGRAREGITLVLIDEMDLLLTRKQKVGHWMSGTKFSSSQYSI